MARVIPNENTWIGFSDTLPADLGAPTAADLDAATDITCLCSTINASAQGNAIPTPDLCTLFEKSIVGTSTATFTADFYRDDVADEAWELFPRGTRGVVYISRFGGTGADHKPVAGENLEVWPVEVTSRTAGPLSSNTPQTFTVTCAVNEEPAEDAVVGGAATAITGVTAGAPGSFQPGTATVPANLTALKADAVVGDTGSNKPSAAWTTGQFVDLGDASDAYWNGTAWAAGQAA